MRGQTCCFTGHRIIPLGEYDSIKEKTQETVEKLIEKGVCYFGAGGALGVDTLAAKVVLEAKKKHPEVKLILILPCYDQDRMWSTEDKRVYVWFEAVMGYLSTGKWVCEQRGIDFYEFMSKDNKNLSTYYVHGKDNIPFHTTIFPALILAMKNNYRLPDYIVSSQYQLLDLIPFWI